MHYPKSNVTAFLIFVFFASTAATVIASEPLNLSKCPQENISDARKFYSGEQDYIARTAGKVARKGLRLELRCHDRLVVLEDDCTNGESYVRYSFNSYISESGYYLIAVTGWEGRGFLLISERTGEQTNIEGFPVFSPDKKRFISVSMDLEAGYNTNSIQIWRVTGDGLKQEYAFDTNNAWGPSDPAWKNNNTIAFKKNFFIEPGADYKSVPALLIHTGNTWEIR